LFAKKWDRLRLRLRKKIVSSQKSMVKFRAKA
jgi:hypothetical protein